MGGFRELVTRSGGGITYRKPASQPTGATSREPPTRDLMKPRDSDSEFQTEGMEFQARGQGALICQTARISVAELCRSDRSISTAVYRCNRPAREALRVPGDAACDVWSRVHESRREYTGHEALQESVTQN